MQLTRKNALTGPLLSLVACFVSTSLLSAEPKPKSFAEIQRALDTRFSEQRGRQPNDLISRSDVEQMIRAAKEAGWDVPDKAEILEQSLQDQHVMVTTFRTASGRRFMRHIAARSQMYDRLDRISEVSGGPQLIRDIVKLPDGERYAKPKSGGGVPDLLDLLPKNSSGQTRRIPDYHEPTGRIYTYNDLVKRLSKSYQSEQTGSKR